MGLVKGANNRARTGAQQGPRRHGKMMAVDVKSGSTFEAGVPKALFDVRIGNDSSYDVNSDGRFLIPTVGEQGAPVPTTVVINWTAGLKR